MISARIVLDSINPAGVRLTTWLLTYPRFIHSEFLTHRVFSRNSASSRAIPPEKIIEMITNEPAMPNRFATYAKGMGDGGVMEEGDENLARVAIDKLRAQALFAANTLKRECNASKQIINRYLEPWMHMTVLATATDHRNFFALRANEAAEPNFQELAYRMLHLYLNNEPKYVAWDGWHLPGLDPEKHAPYSVEGCLKICTALAARASYAAFDEELEPEKAFAIHDRMLVSGHMSPFEHCAKATTGWHAFSNFDTDPERPSQWLQYRKMVPSESRTNVDLVHIRQCCPDWINDRIHAQ